MSASTPVPATSPGTGSPGAAGAATDRRTPARGPVPAVLMVLRVLAVLVAWLAVVILSGSLFDQEADWSPGLLGGAALHVVAYTLGVLAVVWLACRFLDRRRFSSLRVLPGGGRAGRHLAAGLAVGAAMLGVVFLVELALGYVRVREVRWETLGLATALAAVLVVVLTEGAAGVTEEVVFRGYVLQNVAEHVPAWVSILPVSLVFALLHVQNSGFSPAWVVTVLVLAAFLVCTRLWTGALWFAIGWHAAWNITQYGILGLGNVADPPEYRYALLDVEQSGPAWLVGEGESIEGGLIVLVVAAVALLAVLSRPGVLRALGSRLDRAGDPEVTPARGA